ncbi:hypothetical protein LCGC14_0292050 [marine sediment metagenome]|uniref:Uncharacterized protein n=1 Tax=marine sediment metagenome TaxID=412755 RepID=A0A0F9U9V4_9ZZZZ
MENINNISNSVNFSTFNAVIDRSQSQLLSLGYQVVFIKSKIKKRIKIITKIFFFNF